jgi:hypothetical protein
MVLAGLGHKALNEPHAAAEVRPHTGSKGIGQELVSEAKSEIRDVLFEHVTDGRFFGFEKGIFSFLIHIGAPAQYDYGVVGANIRNGLVPNLNNTELDPLSVG